MAEDPAIILNIAETNESTGDWAAALECLERAAPLADEKARARIAEVARRIETSVRDRPELRSRARKLARLATAPAAAPPPARPAPPTVDPSQDELSLERARELLVTPETLRALRKALARARRESSVDRPGPLAVPIEAVLARLLACEIDLDKTVDLALDLVLEATHAVRGFMLARDERGRLEVWRGRGLRKGDVPRELSTAIVAEAERTGRPLFIADATRDRRFSERQSVSELAIRSVACVPIVDARALLGIIYVDDTETSGRFGAAEQEVVTSLAHALAPVLRNALRFEAQRSALARARSKGSASPPRIVGRSAAIAKLLDLVAKVAPLPAPVLIEGESGTGKELVARVIHDLSPRRASPFVAENVAALPAALVEAELFGVKRGAFTGAESDREGIFVRARDGTIFLDEIGELALEGQAKLLRALQEREVRPVGGDKVVRVHARFVAATNRDLATLVREGKFREDLLYRLRVVSLRVPPLRERPEDIPLLCEHILERIAVERGEPNVPLSREALARLVRHEWRGNVRELEAVLWRVAIAGEAALAELPVASPESGGDLGLSLNLPGAVVPLEKARSAFDRAYLLLALERSGWNVSSAARALDVTRPALARILRRHGIERA